MANGENAGEQQFLHFPQCFQDFQGQILYQQIFDISSASAYSLVHYILQSANSFNLSPNKPWFLHVFSTSFLQTILEKKKSLEHAISPFPTVFSNQLEKFLPFLSNFKLSSANSFCLEQLKICCLGKG